MCVWGTSHIYYLFTQANSINISTEIAKKLSCREQMDLEIIQTNFALDDEIQTQVVMG